MARAYELKRRAERQDETRQRIVDATIELHQTIGAAATTVTDIAERAGVGRVTVYRHFPDEVTLSRACSGQYFDRNPFPDLKAWASIADPGERARVALREAYAYHRANKPMFSMALGEAREHPSMQPYHAYWNSAADVLMKGRPERGARRELLRAASALALSFDAWRALTCEQGLSDEQAARLMLELLAFSR
jgi:AcrR family transcriptional regulator